MGKIKSKKKVAIETHDYSKSDFFFHFLLIKAVFKTWFKTYLQQYYLAELIL